MMLCQIDQTVVEIVFGCLTVLGAAGGSYLATRITLATLMARVDSLDKWVRDVADGKTEVHGKLSTRVENHAELIHEHSLRLAQLEREHTLRTARGYCPEGGG
jgi:hypothetical protein